MYNPMSTIIREAKRKPNDKLNILTFPAHERYETGLCKTNHVFYSVVAEGTKEWNDTYATIPENYTIFHNSIPNFILNDIDVIISHNPFVHIPLAYRLQLKVPVINIFHTMPGPGWDVNNIPPEATAMFDWCTEHVYISEFNQLAWGYNKGKIIHHGIDSELFCPANSFGSSKRPQQRVLTVANDYINRDWCLGFSIWKAIAPHLPVFPVGDTPGLSKPPKNTEELVSVYQNSLVFLNTSTLSPIPMSLLEAMSCGCACVSAATCMIPDIIEDGVDGFLCPPDQPEVFKQRCQYLLDHPDEAIAMGQLARQKVQSMFGMERFIKEFNDVLWSVL